MVASRVAGVNALTLAAGTVGGRLLASTIHEARWRTVEQLEGLAAVGCLRVQGYLIARPMQIDHTKAFIREWPDRWLMLPAV